MTAKQFKGACMLSLALCYEGVLVQSSPVEDGMCCCIPAACKAGWCTHWISCKAPYPRWQCIKLGQGRCRQMQARDIHSALLGVNDHQISSKRLGSQQATCLLHSFGCEAGLGCSVATCCNICLLAFRNAAPKHFELVKRAFVSGRAGFAFARGTYFPGCLPCTAQAPLQKGSPESCLAKARGLVFVAVRSDHCLSGSLLFGERQLASPLF